MLDSSGRGLTASPPRDLGHAHARRFEELGLILLLQVVHPFLYTSSSETSVFPARPSSRFSRSVASNVPSRPLRLNCLPAVLSTQYPQSASSAGGHLALRTDCQHAGPVATRVVVACLDEQVAVGQDIDVYADCRGTKGIGDQGQAQSMVRGRDPAAQLWLQMDLTWS